MKVSTPQRDYQRYLPLVEGETSNSSFPAGKESPFGWPALKVDREGLLLRWPDRLSGVTAFRFSIAIDLREAVVVELALGKSGYRVGLCDVQFGYPFQTFEISLPNGLEKAIHEEGLRFRLVQPEGAVWILLHDESGTGVPDALAPHLFSSSGVDKRSRDLWEASFDSLCSTASFQVFGWLEGCVLEGLGELARRVPAWKERAEAAIEAHLDHFFIGEQMIYVGPRSERVVDLWNNNEHGLMMPTLIRYRPRHPAVGRFSKHWVGYLRSQVERLGRNISCEGCYTLSYPVALLSCLHNDEGELLELALDLLLLHQRCLKEGDDIYLYYAYESKERIYPNWLRGVAWYLLGHVRVLAIVRERHYVSPKIAKVEQELREGILRMLPLQNASGLWSNFARESETGDETSGSAGVAGAMLLAAELGYADEAAVVAARRAQKALEAYLSPDGLLSGVSQSNKSEGGEPLQRYGFRGRSQMGQGLAVQLTALAGF